MANGDNVQAHACPNRLCMRRVNALSCNMTKFARLANSMPCTAIKTSYAVETNLHGHDDLLMTLSIGYILEHVTLLRRKTG